MEEVYVEKNVRTRLILSGIAELEEHGLANFSLRRAAIAAQVSCAAPYRHFKDKEDYIASIVEYVNSKWQLLSVEIEKIFSSDKRKLATEMCMAALRFRIANRNFSSVFKIFESSKLANALDTAVSDVVKQYAHEKNCSEEETESLDFFARALISGSLVMLTDDNGDKILELVRKRLESEFK